jgi:chemotaxis response regulator CheB
VQDPKTAEIPIMPEAALLAVPTAERLPLRDLAKRLIQFGQPEVKLGRRTPV